MPILENLRGLRSSRAVTVPCKRTAQLGSKNWLFIGHEKAGPRNAILFTLVQNCRLAKVNPEAWLMDVLHRLDDHPQKRITELLPHNWVPLSKNTTI